jgi:phosphatidylserine/phosphatidylglycerophosphate/cardiolipin synthase-like enzyme
MANKWLKVFPDATKNKVDYLLDGKEYFKSIVEAIRTASSQDHYIYILGWMLDLDFPLIRGDIDTMLIKLIRTAAKKGVEVRILIWENPLEGYKKMADVNIPKLNELDNVKVFIDEHTYQNPASKKFIEDNTSYIKEKLEDLEAVFTDRDMFTAILYQLVKKNVGSHHEKNVVVKGKDGLIGFCGGIDINKNRFDGYHDSACRVEGPAAFEILEKFIKRWKNHPNAKKVKLKGSSEKKPKAVEKDFHYAQVVGTYNSPDGTDKDRSLKKSVFENN